VLRIKTAAVYGVRLCRPTKSANVPDLPAASIFGVLSRHCSIIPLMKAAGSSGILVPFNQTTHRHILSRSKTLKLRFTGYYEQIKMSLIIC